MSISNQEYQRRYAAIRDLMRKNDLDSILVIGVPEDLNRGNIRYIVGTGQGGTCIFPAEGKPIFLVYPNALTSAKMPKTIEAYDLLDFREASGNFDQMNKEVSRLSETPNNVEHVKKELSRLDRGHKVGLVGFNCISVPLYLAVKAQFGDRLIDLPWLFEPLRIVKSAEEIEKIRGAAAVADKVYARLRKIIRPGLSEYKIYGEVKKVVYENGCEYSFDLLDGAGSTINMSFFPTTDRLEENGTLFMEITPAYQGYHAQLPVTLPVGSYQPHVKKMVKAWAEADKEMRKILRPGAKVSDLYRTMINAIEAKGFKSPMRPGHCLGLDILDYWSITGDNNTVLKAGMVLAVHPSVMTGPGSDACGMGYTYLITESGFERLSKVDLAAELI